MVSSNPSNIGGHHSTRYTALRTISTIYRVIAYIVIVVGILASLGMSIAAFSAQGPLQGIGYAVGGLLYVALIALFLMAFAEGIAVFLDIEENTRTNNELLAQLLRPTAANAPTQYNVPNPTSQY